MIGFKRYALAAALVVGATLSFAPSAQAADKVCKLDITANDLIQYDKKELKVAGDCTQVELTLKHSGKLPITAMGHNWVLVNTPDANAVANAGLAAGAKNDHVQAGDKRVIAHTKLIGGGQTATVTFPTSALKKGGDYTYLCTFPGHSAIMRGKLVFG